MNTWEILKQRLNEVARDKGKREEFEVVPDQKYLSLEVVYDRAGKDVRIIIGEAKAFTLLQPDRKHDLEQFAAAFFS